MSWLMSFSFGEWYALISIAIMMLVAWRLPKCQWPEKHPIDCD